MKPGFFKLLLVFAAIGIAAHFGSQWYQEFKFPAAVEQEFKFKLDSVSRYNPKNGGFITFKVANNNCFSHESRALTTPGGSRKIFAEFGFDTRGLAEATALRIKREDVTPKTPFLKVRYQGVSPGVSRQMHGSTEYAHKFVPPFYYLRLNNRVSARAAARLSALLGSANAKNSFALVTIKPDGTSEVKDIEISGRSVAKIASE